MNRIKLRRLLGLGMAIFLFFGPSPLMASITTGTATSLVDVNQGILPSSGYNRVIGLNIVTDAGDLIHGVIVTFNDVGNDDRFTPLDLAHVAVFRDSSNNPVSGQFDAGDTLGGWS